MSFVSSISINHVQQDDNGDVWAIYTDFGWIAHRHGITDRDRAVPHGDRRGGIDHVDDQ